MNISFDKNITGQPIGVSVVSEPWALNSFLDPDCSAAIWAREIPLQTQNWINELDPKLLPVGRVICPTSMVEATIRNLCDISNLPPGVHRTWFEKDIAELANLFSKLTNARYLRLRLGVYEIASCPKFHIDYIPSRLVCTYRGNGTQYGVAKNDDDPEGIKTVRTGCPIVLKGLLWPGGLKTRIVHRSPPTEGPEQTRLLLALDDVADPNEEV